MEYMTYSIPNILIVDDINANLVVLTEMIRNLGYTARPVTSAKQAMSAIEALAPHLILLDVSMPEVDGFEFCAILKKNASTRDIPVIFISALNHTEDKIRGFKLGAVDYISKPFEVEEVTLRINTHLKLYRMKQELELYNKKLYKIINDQIRKIFDEQKKIIHSLTKLSIKRDKIRQEHMERVATNSRLLAMGMQLSPLYKEVISNIFIDSIEHAAPLHDIGKMGIPDSILLNLDSLSPEEWQIYKTHTELGAATLKEIYTYNEHNDFIKMSIDIAWYHHEHWDGTGYPMGLAGTDIPLSARITAIIDDYDEYLIEYFGKSEFSHMEAIAKATDRINEASGTKYDPNIVKIFNKILNQLKK